MWQRAFGIIHEFLSLADGINEGTAYTQQEIMEQFGLLRTRFLITLDIIASEPIFYESMDGAVGRLLLHLNLLTKKW